MKFIIVLCLLYDVFSMSLKTTTKTENKIKSKRAFLNERIEYTDVNHKYNATTYPEFYSPDYYELFPKRFFEVNGNKCKEERCFFPYGICANNQTCKCIKGYLNSNEKNKDKLCSYKQKSQLYAFLLETFTIIGGNIYLEAYYYALVKGICVFIMSSFFIFDIPCKCCGMKDLIDSNCTLCACFKTGSFVICIFGLITWQLADLIRIMSYKSVDDNFMPLDYFF